MKAILCSQYCGPDELVLSDIPDPVAGDGEVVIAIKAAALNFFDLLMIQGKYQIKPPFPFSPAAEIAGVIESVGAGRDRSEGRRSRRRPPAATTARARRSRCPRIRLRQDSRQSLDFDRAPDWR
jgi:NADPH:quinone reductase-like Zn-dependent oxidoreductase